MPCCTIYEYRNTSQTHAKIGRSVRILDELLYPQLSFPHLKTCSASIKAAVPRGTGGLAIPKPSANPSQGRISPSIIASPPALGSAILCVLNSHEGCFSDTVQTDVDRRVPFRALSVSIFRETPAKRYLLLLSSAAEIWPPHTGSERRSPKQGDSVESLRD